MATAQNLSLAIHGVQLGVQAVLFRPARRIGDFVGQVTLQETHVDELEITDHPVEQGAKITDHAYMRPEEVTVRCSWSDSPSPGGFVESLTQPVTGTIAGVNAIISGNGLTQSRDIYLRMLKVQAAREPMSVVTGKRTYSDMLIKSLRVETDKENENNLSMTAVLRRIILVRTQVVTVSAPKEAQRDAPTTLAPTDQGTKQLVPAPTINTEAAEKAINPRDRR